MSYQNFTTFEDRFMSLVPTTPDDHQMTLAGEVANRYAQRGAFPGYLYELAKNTLIRQYGDLTRLADYLHAVQPGLGADMADFAAAVRTWADDRQQDADYQTDPDPAAWRGLTWGLVEGFRNWMIGEGDAVGSINVRLSTVKAYAKIAAKAGAITPETYAMIRTVSGYAHKVQKRIDERREVTRRGDKKAEHTSIEREQAKALKTRPDTPQGRRDAVLMCLLLDHGLRCGEVALIQVADIDLKAGELRFYRPKVDKVQTHELSRDTKRALRAYFGAGDAPAAGPLLRGSRRGGKLADVGMTERAITQRVKVLGEEIGIERLSAHDCRHYWATQAAKKGDIVRLQEAGGWSSLAMPRRYIEAAKIANKGLVETDD